MIQIKRAYDPPSRSDGTRLLVDRLWPRRVSKAWLKADGWVKELAPSTELRKAYGHDLSNWEEFRSKYQKELQAPSAQEKSQDILDRAKKGRVTLVYAARNEIRN